MIIYFYSQPNVDLRKESVRLLFFGTPNEEEVVFWNVDASIPGAGYPHDENELLRLILLWPNIWELYGDCEFDA